MDNYDIKIDSFEGPFDLLLDLIKKARLEVRQIKISDITAPYLASLDNLQGLNMEVAGEFLVMAASLMQMKARSLLPSNNRDGESEDPEFEDLKRKLAEYQQYKEIGKILMYKEADNAQIFYRPAFIADKSDFVLDATLNALAKSFYEALRALPDDVREILYQEIPIEVKIREILDLLEASPSISFNQVLKLQKNKSALIVSFIAVLELIKDKQISATQTENFGEIMLYKINPADYKDEIEKIDGNVEIYNINNNDGGDKKITIDDKPI